MGDLLSDGYLAPIKDWVDLAKNVLTAGAIVAGGMWFFLRRSSHPRLDLTQSISSIQLHEDNWLVRVTVTAKNCGEVMVPLPQGFTRLLQVSPCDQEICDQLPTNCLVRSPDQSRLNWPMLAKVTFLPETPREIEPGESDEIHFDFVVKDAVEVVIAQTNLHNPTKDKGRSTAFAWEKMLLYDLRRDISIKDQKMAKHREASQSSQRQSPMDEQTRVGSDPRPVSAPAPVTKPAPNGSNRQAPVEPDPRPVVAPIKKSE